jgi:hypothetical protein
VGVLHQNLYWHSCFGHLFVSIKGEVRLLLEQQPSMTFVHSLVRSILGIRAAGAVFIWMMMLGMRWYGLIIRSELLEGKPLT